MDMVISRLDPHEIEGYCAVCGRPIMLDDWRGYVGSGMVCEFCAEECDYIEEVE